MSLQSFESLLLLVLSDPASLFRDLALSSELTRNANGSAEIRETLQPSSATSEREEEERDRGTDRTRDRGMVRTRSESRSRQN